MGIERSGRRRDIWRDRYICERQYKVSKAPSNVPVLSSKQRKHKNYCRKSATHGFERENNSEIFPFSILRAREKRKFARIFHPSTGSFDHCHQNSIFIQLLLHTETG